MGDELKVVADLVSSRMDALGDDLLEIRSELVEIRKQTQATNGRVNRHDHEIDTLKKAKAQSTDSWRFRLTTAVALLAAIWPATEALRALGV